MILQIGNFNMVKSKMKKQEINKFMGLKIRRSFLFYFFSVYILSLFFWWWTMIFYKNNQLYREKELQLYYQYDQSESVQFMNENESLMKEKEKQRWMIIGEGATFLILILLGMYRLRINISREVGLASMEKNFLLSITHELKSPLASARLNLQTLNNRKLSEEQQKLLLRNTESDVIRLNDLVEKILLASKMGHHSMQMIVEELNLSELAEECIDAVLNRNPELKIDTQIEDSVWVNGDDVMLKSLVLNLLENAVKYAPQNTSIGLSLKKENKMAVLEVSDQGKAIPEEEQERIFKRFYRMGNEETRTHTGVGLGLYIVHEVTMMHHGDIKIVNKKPSGKAFKVEIPYIGGI